MDIVGTTDQEMVAVQGSPHLYSLEQRAEHFLGFRGQFCVSGGSTVGGTALMARLPFHNIRHVPFS
jgi:hypothetical protein